MKRTCLLVWLIGLFLSPHIALAASKASPVPKSLLQGIEKENAFCDKAEIGKKLEIYFFNGNKLILTLTGVVAEKWRKCFQQLGPCKIQGHTFAVTSGKGTKGTIYRFAGGIIVSYRGQAYAMDWEAVKAWESVGGYKGNLGFPSQDNIELTNPKPVKGEIF